MKDRHTRTLFVRNIAYECSEDELRQMFERYGEIKKLYSLVEKKGMAFITYVSILPRSISILFSNS